MDHDGSPGHNGKIGGHLTIITEICKNAEWLLIDVSGGIGGNGQDGGDGMKQC